MYKFTEKDMAWNFDGDTFKEWENYTLKPGDIIDEWDGIIVYKLINEDGCVCGIDYNFCYDWSIESDKQPIEICDFYPVRYDRRDINFCTDTDKYIRYGIDFGDPEWKSKFIRASYDALIEFMECEEPHITENERFEVCCVFNTYMIQGRGFDAENSCSNYGFWFETYDWSAEDDNTMWFFLEHCYLDDQEFTGDNGEKVNAEEFHGLIYTYDDSTWLFEKAIHDGAKIITYKNGKFNFINCKCPSMLHQDN